MSQAKWNTSGKRYVRDLHDEDVRR